MFKKDFERTPEERARRAQFSIIARLGGCGYLVYIMVQLLQMPEESRTTLMIVLAVILLAGAVAVIGFTIYDLFRSLKTGRFNPAFYEDLDNSVLNQPDQTAEEDKNALEAPEEDVSDEDSDEDEDAADDEDGSGETKDGETK